VEGPLFGQALGNPLPLKPVDPAELLGDRSGFVGLQPTDEMPAQIQPPKALHLGQRLLQVAFSEMAQAEAGRGLHCRGLVPLAHGHERDRILIPSSLARSSSHTSLNRLDPGAKIRIC